MAPDGNCKLSTHEAVDAAQPVTRPELDAALAALENRLTMRMFGSVFAAPICTFDW